MKFRALNRARKRRRVVRGGLGRGASGGARNMDPKSAPSMSPPDLLPDVEKNADVISLPLAVPAPPPFAFAGRATDMKRDTKDGIRAVASRTKRDADLAALGTRLAIFPMSRPGCDCRKREPVSVRGDRVPALHARVTRHQACAARIRVQARLRAARPRPYARCRARAP